MAANTSQEVRIIGGKWKGRKLRFAGDQTLRPTVGRIRETLFNWLRPHIAGTHCLDLFAGSGVLGFEALSQGAASCHFIESNPRTLRAIKENADNLVSGAAAQHAKSDALRFLSHTEQRFDIAFLDPPYSKPQLLERALELIQQRNLVTEFIYLEARDKSVLDAAAERWDAGETKATRAGDAHAILLCLR